MQTPNKGQPIDYSYITQIVNAINDLQAEQNTKSKIAESSENAGESPLVELNSKNVVFYTGFVSIANDSTSTVHTQTKTYSFKNAGFKQAPVVTVTASATSASGSVPEKVVLGISDVTATGFTIRMNFLEKDIPSIGVHIVAIGQPAR